jgi:hypothetical protein
MYHYRHIVREHLKGCLAKTLDRIEWLLQLEDNPFTLNSHYLSDYKDQFLCHYKSVRQDINAGVFKKLDDAGAKSLSMVLSGLAGLGIEGIKRNDLAKLLVPDSMESALLVMAEVRAYFQG